MSDPEATSSTARKVFLFVILAYLMLWITSFVVLWRTFGVGPSAVLSILTGIPFAIALRMYSRFPATKKREFVFLLIVFGFALGGAGYMISVWTNYGLHHRYADYIKCTEFVDFLHEDPAFKDVECENTSKGCIFCGTVATEADLERLESIKKKHHHIGGNFVEVREVASEEPSLPH